MKYRLTIARSSAILSAALTARERKAHAAIHALAEGHSEPATGDCRRVRRVPRCLTANLPTPAARRRGNPEPDSAQDRRAARRARLQYCRVDPCALTSLPRLD